MMVQSGLRVWQSARHVMRARLASSVKPILWQRWFIGVK